MLGHFVDNSVAFPLERYVLDVFPWGQDLDYESRISRRSHMVGDRCACLGCNRRALLQSYMTRYKGRTKPTLIERKFPHHVEVAVPSGGLGRQLDAMYDWHHARGIEAMRGRSRLRARICRAEPSNPSLKRQFAQKHFCQIQRS